MQEYVKLHQHYLTSGEGVVNEWSMCFLGKRNLADRVRRLPKKVIRASLLLPFFENLSKSGLITCNESRDLVQMMTGQLSRAHGWSDVACVQSVNPAAQDRSYERVDSKTDYAEWLNRSTIVDPSQEGPESDPDDELDDGKVPVFDALHPISKYEDVPPDSDTRRGSFPPLPPRVSEVDTPNLSVSLNVYMCRRACVCLRARSPRITLACP